MTLLADRKECVHMSESRSPLPAVVTSPCLVPALLSGFLLWMCHFPVAWGWLSWVALVPLLTLTRAQAPPRRIYWCAYLGGLAFFVPVLQWMRVADYRMYATWAMLAFYCAAYFPVGLWFIRWLDRRSILPLCLNVAIVWTGLEWVRSFLLTGFAWYYLGHAQHRFASLIQIADIGGVYAISFLVAAFNGWLGDLVLQLPALRDRFHWTETTVGHASAISLGRGAGGLRPGMWTQAVLLVTMLIAAVLYGTWQLDHNQFTPGPRLALLQGNLDQRIRNAAAEPDAPQNTVESIYIHYAQLCYLTALRERSCDLVIWPETSFPASLYDISPDLPIEKVPESFREQASWSRNNLLDFVTKVVPPTAHLMGMITNTLDAEGKTAKYSSSLLVPQDGKPERRYDKMHRVPFGEYVPLRDWFPFMNYLAPYDSDYSIAIGKNFTRFPLRDVQYGCLICYEDTDPFLARRYVQDGPDGKPVDFLVNQSNDGWFDGSSEHDEHLVISRFRAIECRRPLVRAVNMGISAVIDGNGTIARPTALPALPPDPNHTREFREALARLKVWDVSPRRDGTLEELPPSEYGAFKKEAGVLLARVPLDGRWSFYAHWGDWLPIGCWIVVGSLLAWGYARRPT